MSATDEPRTGGPTTGPDHAPPPGTTAAPPKTRTAHAARTAPRNTDPAPADPTPPRVPPGARTPRLRATAIFLGDRPYLLTVALVGLITVTGLSGPDWPAQQFRAWLAREHGAVLWNNQWYGGHLLPGYSVITPTLAGGIGTRTLTALSCVLAAWTWGRLRVGSPGLPRRIAALWFAAIICVEYLIGRTPFVLGVAAALLAVLAARSAHPLWAASAALLSGLASPLAGAFLLMTALAWVPAQRVWATRFAFAPAAVGLGTALAFPSGGDFGFPFWRLGAILGFAAVGLYLLPTSHQTARRFLWLYAVSGTVLYLVPSAVGGNVARLGEVMAGPLAAVVLLSLGRRRLVALLAVPLLAWQLSSASIAVAHDFKDSAADDTSYYTGMLAFLRSHNQPVGRVEIPFTRGHWESVYVAEHQPLARGWERQLDRDRNAALYDPRLDAAGYHAWLRETGVRYIALPDVPLDESARREAKILKAGTDWLRPVWSDAHWRIWELTDPTPLLDGPGRLTELSPSSFTFVADAPGTFTVRIHHTAWFTTDHPGTRITGGTDDWTRVTVTTPGPVTVTARASALLP
ncbi:hypothetical protein [Yinghuangia seranimata]|uniref:hypothetical protein n=1 Tax=Yinghuangia seranimata TaxID=408067 RepID=UPI00248D36B3|nr:hypothetical protein [Yinghuangia seranimata]MDI2128654.1 hypothetical protein [Yinghuangia seranimata]